jgi:predicted site-specific integrase-resolvase
VDHHRKYLKPATAAEKIGVTIGTLANWRWKGIGPAFYAISGMIRYTDDEIDAWITAGRQSAGDALGESTGGR